MLERRGLRGWMCLATVVVPGSSLLFGACGRVIEPVTSVPLDSANDELVELVQELRQSIRALPSSAEMRGRLGMAYEVNDFYSEAADTYAQAQALDPGDFRWPYFRAVLVAESGDFEAALKILDEALTLDVGYPPAWLYRGAWLNALGLYGEARTAYARVWDANPAKFSAADMSEFGDHAHAGVARAFVGERRYQDALEVVEPLAGKVRQPQVYRLLGRVYQALGRTDDARIAMARGKDATPMTWHDPLQRQKWKYEASFGRKLMHGERLLQAGRFEEAVEVLEPIRASNRAEDAVFINLSLAYGRSGETQKALAVAREGFDASPDNYRFHNVFAGIYQSIGDDEQAVRHLRQSIDKHPAQVWPHERLANILMRQERYEEALQAVDAALRYGAENPERLHYLAGMLEGVRERWPESVARFQEATALNASFTIAYIYLGRCLAEMGRFDEARAALAWARRLDDANATELASAERLLADLEGEV